MVNRTIHRCAHVHISKIDNVGGRCELIVYKYDYRFTITSNTFAGRAASSNLIKDGGEVAGVCGPAMEFRYKWCQILGSFMGPTRP